ncbi:hypothetical protein FRX31_035141 [Thalictrum thalictroides]|uniref:Avr9/Cf-9 rapidly elicited protein n=1 Tax=Thalictrum thalictroides TaxID=46969 RepID=A0A7J6URV5_THATH|nr:hypothetical protein FRX31_035141 [Thalictrum thalictroides]
MNSIFSSFDALCFEYFLHKKVGFQSFFAISTCTINKVEGKNTQSGQNEKSSKGTSEATASKPPQQQQKQKSGPRFAPELDGLNCFETIIS